MLGMVWNNCKISEIMHKRLSSNGAICMLKTIMDTKECELLRRALQNNIVLRSTSQLYVRSLISSGPETNTSLILDALVQGLPQMHSNYFYPTWQQFYQDQSNLTSKLSSSLANEHDS